MAQVLILKVNTPTADRGDIVEIRGSNETRGGAETNSFVWVEVIDAVISDYHHLRLGWRRILTFSTVANTSVSDNWRLKIQANQNSKGLGSIERLHVEQYINSWNGTVFSDAPNEVVFDITILDAFSSNAFWGEAGGMDVSNLVFTETDYNSGTGEHTVEVDYSFYSGKSTTAVENTMNKMTNNGVVGHDGVNRIITITFKGSLIKTTFQDDLGKCVDEMVVKFRYKVSNAVVNTIESTGGYMNNVLKATFNGYVQDKSKE